MSSLSVRDIEVALLPFRNGRRIVLKQLLESLGATACTDLYLLLSRLFVRLKSGDSILEKAKRKNIHLETPSDIASRIPDALGFRIITSDSAELTMVYEMIRRKFEILSENNTVAEADPLGRREINCSCRYVHLSESYDFELQLRTVLQHYWAARSFHLFHKQAAEKAARHASTLISLSNLLAAVETAASRLDDDESPTLDDGNTPVSVPALTERTNLMVVEPGERFAKHIVIPSSGDDTIDHERIVEEKMALYSQYPDAAIVECTCVSFLSFLLNEPLVKVPIRKFGNIRS